MNGTRPDNPPDRVLQSLSGLTGTTITLQTTTSQRYEGVVDSTTNEGDAKGVTLRDVKDITAPGFPSKDQLFVSSTNIDSYTSGPADAKPANGDSFRTDTDISHKKGPGRERDLQAWVASGDTTTSTDGLGDDDTFGPGANGNTSWDQFSANETLFGVKASFDEDVYTTKLDRSAPDFKERERKAQRIANEIIGAATNNPHIAEERGFNVDDSGANEEDKYGAVVRGQNAYVPPGARKTGAGPPSAEHGVTSTKGDVPKVSVNGPDGTSVAAQAQSPPSSKAASPAPLSSGSSSNPNKPPADPLPAFIAFVTNEKQRLTQKRQALVKSEMDKRMAELVKFSKDFKLNKPIPEDLVPILAKDEGKQQAIKEKASKDAASSQARAIGASNPTTASRGLVVAGAKNSDPTRKPIAQALGNKNASNNAQASITAANAQKMASVAAASAAAAAATSTAAKPAESTTSKKISMVIQTIPPFRGKDNKGKQNANAVTTTSSTPVTANGPSANTNQNTTNNNAARNSASPAIPASPNTVANRLNVNASSFRPNPKVSHSPKMNAPNSASTSSKANKSDSAPTTPNPFFGTRSIKKSPAVNIKDDFNPFKHNKVADAAQVATLWPYSGKRYMQLFPTPQHQPPQHPTHMAPLVPPPMPPPSYEEDSAAQAAASRGYVYAYPPYGYPAQHMMQGMPPPGPPGAYMPGPYMQPMPYPPGMPPPNAMYSPGMGQMPPPQGYMPPPPGAYPPPPNGAGRPSMPPTPIQANAHPYYHQSPQLQHAYPMMMPPPPNIPPHGYEGGPPPVQMGGHS
jgi:PAB1-binding protein PBP1